MTGRRTTNNRREGSALLAFVMTLLRLNRVTPATRRANFVFRHFSSRTVIRALLILPLVLAGCVSREQQVATGKERYLAAKEACVAAYMSSLVAQSDCRSRAADQFIRPWYRYPDLMTELQQKRRALAARVDAGKMTRAEFDRQVARAERASNQEEARRNRETNVVSTQDDEPVEE